MKPLYSMFALALFLAYAGNAHSISIQFGGLTQPVLQGELLDVDVDVSDLNGEILSAFDVAITYDSSVVALESITFGDFLGSDDFFEVITSSDTSTPDVIALSSISLLFDSELVALQPASFSLASLNFLAIGSGPTELKWNTQGPAYGFVGSGGTPLTVGITDVQFEVQPEVTTVAEPAQLALLMIGGLAGAGARRFGKWVNQPNSRITSQ